MLGLRGAAVEASRILHANLVANVLHLPARFFDTTPTGRIINRYAKDVDTIDASIPDNFSSFLATTCKILGGLTVIAMSTPLAITAFVPLFVLYFFIQVLDISTGVKKEGVENSLVLFSRFCFRFVLNFFLCEVSCLVILTACVLWKKTFERQCVHT